MGAMGRLDLPLHGKKRIVVALFGAYRASMPRHVPNHETNMRQPQMFVAGGAAARVVGSLVFPHSHE
jgi:hypothetical protein